MKKQEKAELLRSLKGMIPFATPSTAAKIAQRIVRLEWELFY